MRFALANSTEERHAGLISLANDAGIGADGWVRLASYGDHPLTREVIDAGGVAVVQQFIQRVTRENATALANEHNSTWGKLRKLRRGAPILAHHTDRWDVAKQEGILLAAPKPAALANTKFGTVARLEARADGLYGLPIFHDEAQPLIEREGLKYFSPFWWTDVVAVENETPVVVPTELISVALTADPNLKDSPALANAAADTTATKASTMKKKLIELLKKHGIALANEEDATIEAALPELGAKLDQRVALENEKTTAATALANEQAAHAAARTALANEQTEHGKTRTALENAITELNEMTVNLAIAEGRISGSERAAKLAGLKAGPDARQALLNEAVKYKVTPVTTDARREGSKTTDDAGAKKAARRLVALGNELFARGGYDSPEAAYAGAKETDEGQKLVAQLEEFKAASKKD